MALWAIAYQSTLASAPSELPRIVDDAARLNELGGVTGVLLFDGSRFLQYLEGPEDGVKLAYDRVCNARSHGRVVELARGRVPARSFPNWRMRMLQVGAGVIEQLVTTDWADFSGRATPDAFAALLIDRMTREAARLPSGLTSFPE